MKFYYHHILGLQVTLGIEPTFKESVKSNPIPKSFYKKNKNIIPRTKKNL